MRPGLAGPLEDVIWKRRYLLMGGLLWVLLMIQTAQMQWSSDIWQHVAAIRELMVNPLAPGHPFVAEQLPHFSFSAYHWLAAYIGGWAGITPLATAQVLAAINGALILLTFPAFVRAFLGTRPAVLWALALVLVAWGPGAWRYSGFLHLNAIGFALPYPSAFATWLTFATVGWFAANRSAPGRLWAACVGLAIAGFLVANAHIITFVLLVVSLGALWWKQPTARAAVLAISSVAGASLGTLLWPLFDLFDLMLNASGAIDAGNVLMYVDPLPRLGLALLGVVPLVQRLRASRLDPLALAFTGMVVIYLVGWLYQRPSLGRVIFFVGLFLHLALAGWLRDLWSQESRARQWIRIAIVSALVLATLNMLPGLVRMVPFTFLPEALQADPRLRVVDPELFSLRGVVAHGEVVLTSPSLKTEVTSVAGKVVCPGAVPYLEDWMARETDCLQFFAEPLANKATLGKYDVVWILIAPSDISSTIIEALSQVGESRRIGEYLLIEVF